MIEGVELEITDGGEAVAWSASTPPVWTPPVWTPLVWTPPVWTLSLSARSATRSNAVCAPWVKKRAVPVAR